MQHAIANFAELFDLSRLHLSRFIEDLQKTFVGRQFFTRFWCNESLPDDGRSWMHCDLATGKEREREGEREREKKRLEQAK